MSFFYGISSNYASEFFNSFSSSNGRQNFSNLNGLYSSLGDYGTIRNGTYSRLMKSYYTQKGSGTESGSDSTNTVPTDKTIAADASTLKKDADALSASKFTEENRTKITAAVTKFTDSYNRLMKAASSSDNHAVSQKQKSLASLTSRYSTVLNSIGVSINSDQTLTVDSKTLEKADMSALKSVLSGNYSYTSQTGNYAALIYSANSNGMDSIYNSQGTLGTWKSSSVLDTSV